MIAVYFENMVTGERDAVYVWDAFDRADALRQARQAFVKSLQWKIYRVRETEDV